jgi:hypothetical protein
MRRYYLYTQASPASWDLLHQVGQLQQIFVPEQAPARSQSHKGICCHHCRPARWDRTQAASAVVEVNAILTPVVTVRDQLKSLAPQRMMWMGDFESTVGMVGMRCS